jgi:hypothetical protein
MTMIYDPHWHTRTGRSTDIVYKAAEYLKHI